MDFLSKTNLEFEHVFSSQLHRGWHTAKSVFWGLKLNNKADFHCNWKLNERHFGDISGKPEEDLPKEKDWVAPFLTDPKQPHIKEAESKFDWLQPKNYEMFKDLPPQERDQLPNGESVQETRARLT